MNEKNIEEILEEAAAKIAPEAHFKAQLERQLRDAHKSRERFFMFKNKNLVSTLGFIVAAALLLFALNWAFRSLAPKTIPGAGRTPMPTQLLEGSPTPPPTPSMESYDFNGTKLYLAQPLPESLAEANVYFLNKDQPATIDEARTLAQQFGIQGNAYAASGQIPNTKDYVFTDGKQLLSVHSKFYFNYASDIVKNKNNFDGAQNPNAETIIADFLKSHGFDFPVRIEWGGLHSGYIVQPLAPDGIPMQYEYFAPPVMRVTLDENGQVLSLNASLMDYNQTPVGTFGIVSATEALQKILNFNIQGGKIEGMHSSGSATPQEWRRQYPDNQIVMIYGYVSSYPAVDASKPALILIDGVFATGNVQGLDKLAYNTYVKTSGQYVVENSVRKFKVDSWSANGVTQSYIMGTLHQDGDQIVLTSDDGSNQQYPLLDPPADLPLDTKTGKSQFSVTGVIVDGKMFWTYIQYFASSGNMGGGGGGGGLGFYQLNLSGTPVPFPTSEPTSQSGGGGGGGNGGTNYTVQAGDTISSIASANNISAEELMKANGITDPATLTIGQTLAIPGTNSSGMNPPFDKSRVDGLRGVLSITLHKKIDGSQTTEYNLVGKDNNGQYFNIILKGSSLQNLSAYQGLPFIVSGTITVNNMMVTVNVEQYQIPFPDLQYQIIKGTQKFGDIAGQTVTVFTNQSGQSYVQLNPNGDPDQSITGQQGDVIEQQVLIIPDETFGGKPALRIYSSSIIASGSSGLAITANQPNIINDTVNPVPIPENYISPALTIEKVELVYFVSNPLYQANDPNANRRSPYIQPAWHFSGHYSNGDEFDIIVQTLKQEFLSPEIAPYIQGG